MIGLTHAKDSRHPESEKNAVLNAARSRGQRLVYAIAPSKTTWFPDGIGSSFPCPLTSVARNYAKAIPALTKVGVDFDDGRAAVETARQPGVDFFPRNATHWNLLGAGIFVNAMINRLLADGIHDVAPFYFLIFH